MKKQDADATQGFRTKLDENIPLSHELRSERTSERCERTSERMSEWPFTNILLARGLKSLCNRCVVPAWSFACTSIPPYTKTYRDGIREEW